MYRHYNDKRPREPRKREHYNRKGVEKQPFGDEKSALSFIERKRLRFYTPYLCPFCSKYHIGRKFGASTNKETDISQEKTA